MTTKREQQEKALTTGTLRMAYAGRRVDRGGRIAQQWQAEHETEPRWYGKPLIAYSQLSVGAVYEFATTDDGRVWVRGADAPRYVDRADGPLVDEWRAQDLAAGVEQARKALLAKAAKVEPLEDLLAPLRALSLRLTKAERRALGVKVLEALGL